MSQRITTSMIQKHSAEITQFQHTKSFVNQTDLKLFSLEWLDVEKIVLHKMDLPYQATQFFNLQSSPQLISFSMQNESRQNQPAEPEMKQQSSKTNAKKRKKSKHMTHSLQGSKRILKKE